MEVEIKLCPPDPAAGRRAFFDGELLPSQGETRSIAMRTVYYTDPQGLIRKNKWTLRLRRENGRGVVTFKSRLRGLSRLELDCDAEDIASGAAALAQKPELPEGARELLLQGSFSPMCGAAFTRLARTCTYEGTVMELSLDEGELTGGRRREALNELELELVSGDESALLRAASALGARYGLVRLRTSKQQRAMALCEEDAL